MGLTRLAIQRPIVLLMVILALMVLGWRARMEMPSELDPRVEFPVINIITVFPGAGPEEVEQQLTRPLEDAVSSVSNVTNVSSQSMENVSAVTVSLKLGTDTNAAAADVRARIEAIRKDLPNDIETPQVAKFDYNARPVMVLGVTGSQSLQELRQLVDETIRPRLSEVPGLGSVTVVGGLRREVQIQVDPERLAASGLSLLDLLRPLGAASVSAPAGTVLQGDRDVSVRVTGEFRSLDELRNTPLPVDNRAAMSMPAGAMGMGMMSAKPPIPEPPLRLRDIATVKDTTAEREQITRVGRKESIGLILSRVSDANTVQVAEGVQHALETLKERLPEHVKISVLQDHSRAVGDALEDINATLILGAILAVLVVYLFLHSWKDTLIVAFAIPTSIVATFLVMYFAGFSLNQMTMLALSLSVGILVDDSILVLECIHRHRAMGKTPREAALDGREEIGLADAANTFVDVVVFIPIAFMGGIVGQFFKQFGITIATATLLSLYVSFTVTPMLAARWFRAGEELEPVRGRFARAFDNVYERLEVRYRRALRWALRHRLAVVVLGFGSLFAVGALSFQVIGFDFTPSIDRGQVNVSIELPPGSTLKSTDALMARVEAEAAQIPEVDPDRMFASVGEVIGGFGSLPEQGAQFGQLTLMLKDKQGLIEKLTHPNGQAGRRNRSDEDVAEELRKRIEKLSGAQYVSVAAARGFTATLAPIQIALYGNDMDELERVSSEIERRMSRVPGLQNVDSTLRRGKPELRVSLDRTRADELLVTSGELAGTLRTAIAGNTDFQFRDREHAYPIRLMLERGGERGTEAGPDALKSLILTHRGPTPVTVGDVADLRLAAGPTKILRSHRMRRVILSSNVREGVSLGTAQAAIEKSLADIPLGAVELKWEGDVDDMQESSMLMAGALGLAVALSYMLMAGIFNSLAHPLTIMVSVPMALVGGLMGLIYTGTTMNIVSMIGIVMLVGLVSKNAILLVDYTNTLRERGLRRTEALEEAGPVRLRPILMTTFSTTIAMLPVALQIGRASEMRSPMAIVVIGGLILSTLLTLLVIPAMYTYMDDLQNAVMRAWARVVPPPRVSHPENGKHENGKHGNGKHGNGKSEEVSYVAPRDTEKTEGNR